MRIFVTGHSVTGSFVVIGRRYLLDPVGDPLQQLQAEVGTVPAKMVYLVRKSRNLFVLYIGRASTWPNFSVYSVRKYHGLYVPKV